MRVLAYADSLEFSGAESSFALIVAGLCERGDLLVEAALPPGRLADELCRSCAVHALPRVPLRAGLASLDGRLRRRVRRLADGHAYDVVLVNLPSAQSGTSGLAAGPPSVGFLHVPHPLASVGFVLGGLRDRVAAPRLRRATRIVVPAPSIRRYVSDRWGFAPEHVGWAPPPCGELRPVARVPARIALDLPHDRYLIGILGRLSAAQKGHDVLLRAFSQIRSGARPTELVIAGEGGDADRMVSLAGELGVADHVRILGALRRPEELYGAVDALAIPSRFEGLPLVALEALRLAVPGVASDVDGLADVWPPEWLVAPGDASALAHALDRMRAADPVALRGRAASRWVELEPTFGRRSVERVLDVLRAAAAA